MRILDVLGSLDFSEGVIGWQEQYCSAFVQGAGTDFFRPERCYRGTLIIRTRFLGYTIESLSQENLRNNVGNLRNNVGNYLGFAPL